MSIDAPFTSGAIRVVELRSTYRDGGGPDKTILLSAAQHDRAVVDVRCIYLRSAHDTAFNIGKRAASLGIPFEEVLEHGPLDLRAVADLAQRIRAHHPHVLHAHDYKTDILGLLLRPFLPGVVLLSTAHGWTLDNSRMNLYNQLDQRALPLYDHVIAVSEVTKGHLLRAGVRPERLSVLYNGIDTNTWKPGDRLQASRQLKARFGLPAEARVLGFIGRLSAEKDLPTAMAVAAAVLESDPSLMLLVVGEGAMQDELPKLAAQHGILERVKAVGHQKIGPELYQGLDAYFMTSKTEGLPNTLLEAMACGIPSVATAVGGIPELVGSSQAVALAPSGDVSALSRALLQILADPARAQVQGEVARARILEAFSFQDRLERIESLYQQLAQRRTLMRAASPLRRLFQSWPSPRRSH